MLYKRQISNGVKNKKGFTFIETLVVLGIIAVLATAVVVAVNPAKRFEDARDKQREIHLQAILNAVNQKRAVTGQDCENIPDEIDEITSTPQFKTIGTDTDGGKYDLFSCLVPFYLDNALFDPDDGSKEDTHYEIWQNPYTKRITVRYKKADGEEIVAGPKEYWILSVPTVTITAPTADDITHTSVDLMGEVTQEGGAAVLETGFIWGVQPELTILDNHIIGSSLSAFDGVIIGLTPDTQYYVCAYAKNDIGVGYDCDDDNGNAISFQTLDARPGVKTLDANEVTVDQATLYGEVTSLGPDVSSVYRYFKWAQSRENEYNEETATKTSESLGGLGLFSHTLYDLEYNPDVLVYYSFQACARSFYPGERCGEVKEFYTETRPPLVTTILDNNKIGAYEATLGGTITNNGGSDITARGICYAEGAIPVHPGDCLFDDDLIGNDFEITITGLNPGKLHKVFAFAENGKGPGFGTILDFTTLIVPPTIEETIIGVVDHQSAELGGKISADGGDSILVHGVCWAEPGDSDYNAPILPDDCLNESGGQVNVSFIYKLNNFLAGTAYNVRAFARSEKGGVGYDTSIESFTTTSPAQIPVLGQTEVTDKTQTTADFEGIIQNNGGAQIMTEHGFCWSKSEAKPTPEFPPSDGGCKDLGSVVVPVSKDGVDFKFTFTATNLSMGTGYYVRAFAKNEKGYGYGWEEAFDTDDPLPPSVTTTEATEIIGQTAKAGGEITNTGGDPETIGGVCYQPSFPGPTYPASGGSACTLDREKDDPLIFISQMTGLVGGYTYYYRAYASNPAGTRYGTEYSFVAGSELGTTCSVKEECKSGNCVDGVCCEGPCVGDCRSCNIAGSVGTCTLAANNTDPREQCLEDWSCNSSKCSRAGLSGYCDGVGACQTTRTESIPSGYVCTGLGQVTPVSSSTYCNIVAANNNNCQYTTYYRSCDGSGACRTDNTAAASVQTTCGPNQATREATSCTAVTTANYCSGPNYDCSTSCQIRTSYRGCAGSGSTCETALRVISTSNCASSQYCSGGYCAYGYPAACQYCSGGYPAYAPSTTWGAYQYGCYGSTKRCYNNGSISQCVTCNGILAPDGCSGCAGQGSLACWYAASATNQTCTTVCSGRGCVDNVGWNDTVYNGTDCYVCRTYFGSGRVCGSGGAGEADPVNFTGFFSACYKRITSPTCQDCSYYPLASCGSSNPVSYRLCVCNY